MTAPQWEQWTRQTGGGGVFKQGSRDADTFLSDYRDAGITPSVTTITVSGTFPCVLPPPCRPGLAPGTVAWMQTLLCEYTWKQAPTCIFISPFSLFKLAASP